MKFVLGVIYRGAKNCPAKTSVENGKNEKVESDMQNDMKSRLMALYEKKDWKGIVETMAKNPGDKGDVVSMLDGFSANVDYEEAAGE